MQRIVIEINEIKLTATISNTKIAKAIYDALPYTGIIQRWGDELMFEFPVHMTDDGTATRNVEIGDMAYSTREASLCLFIGRTPISTGKKPKAHNLVTVCGKMEGNPEVWNEVKSRSQVQIKKWGQKKPESSSPVASQGKVIPIWRDTA